MWEVIKRGAGSDHGGSAQIKQYEICCKRRLCHSYAVPRWDPCVTNAQTGCTLSQAGRSYSVQPKKSVEHTKSADKAAGSPEAVATHWSTGEKATAQMPRLWPRRVTASTRSGMRHTCAQAAHLSAPSSCKGSCCARNTHRVGRASEGPCTGPVGGELHQLGGHAVAGPPTNQLQTTTGHLSGHFLKGSVQQDDFCDEGLCLGDNACRDTASRVHASKVPAPAAHLGSPVLRAGAQQSVIWRKGNAVDVLVMGSNGSHGRQLERISTQILRCRRCLATLLVGLAVLGPLQDSCQVPNFQDLVSAT